LFARQEYEVMSQVGLKRDTVQVDLLFTLKRRAREGHCSPTCNKANKCPMCLSYKWKFAKRSKELKMKNPRNFTKSAKLYFCATFPLYKGPSKCRLKTALSCLLPY
jgi:hypothetical protein